VASGASERAGIRPGRRRRRGVRETAAVAPGAAAAARVAVPGRVHPAAARERAELHLCVAGAVVPRIGRLARNGVAVAAGERAAHAARPEVRRVRAGAGRCRVAHAVRVEERQRRRRAGMAVRADVPLHGARRRLAAGERRSDRSGEQQRQRMFPHRLTPLARTEAALGSWMEQHRCPCLSEGERGAAAKIMRGEKGSSAARRTSCATRRSTGRGAQSLHGAGTGIARATAASNFYKAAAARDFGRPSPCAPRSPRRPSSTPRWP